MEVSLEKKVFFLHEDGRISKILKNDLTKIIDLIKKEIKDASIVLGGSLAYGEGRYLEENNKIKFLSDFDIYLVIPSLFRTIKSLKNPRLKNLPESLGLSNSVELIFVWEKLLSFRLTTIAGEILMDNGRIKKVLNNLPVPRSTNNLKRAYKYLIMGIADLSKGNEYIGRAMIQGFQAWLMLLKKDAKYELWNNFFSLKYDLKEVDSVKDFSGEAACSLLKETLMDFLDIEKRGGYKVEDFFLAREFLDKVYSSLKPTFEVNDYIRYISFHLKKGRFPNPFINSTKHYLDSARLFLDAVEGFNKFDEKKLKKAEKLLNRLTGEADGGGKGSEIFIKSRDKFKNYDEVYLHKLKHKIN